MKSIRKCPFPPLFSLQLERSITVTLIRSTLLLVTSKQRVNNHLATSIVFFSFFLFLFFLDLESRVIALFRVQERKGKRKEEGKKRRKRGIECNGRPVQNYPSVRQSPVVPLKICSFIAPSQTQRTRTAGCNVPAKLLFLFFFLFYLAVESSAVPSDSGCSNRSRNPSSFSIRTASNNNPHRIV